MRRREFNMLLGGIAAAWPLRADAQQTAKIPRIGVLWHAGNEQEEAMNLGALRKGLNDLGYVEGKNIELINRFADEHYDRFDALATELVEAKVDIIFASLGLAAISAKRVTTKIPIVLAYGGDFVAAGLAQSLAHPAGNVTGLTGVFVDLAAKYLEILKDTIANLSVVALLLNRRFNWRAFVSEVQNAADSLRVSLHVVEVGSPDELRGGFSAIVNSHAQAVLLTPDGMFYQQRKRIADLAIANVVPTIGWMGEVVEAGALMSYGADTPDLFRRAATYVDKILKGANPADLPIEQPTKFEFIINLKTAKAIGLTILPNMLARADKVIE
jgi:putative tryptophan/tyrosine transport system substrate-binding protein